MRRNVHVSIYEITNRYSGWSSSGYISVTKSEKGAKKASGKTVSAFLGAKEQIQNASSEMEEALPKVKEAARKVAVKQYRQLLEQ